MKLSPWEGRDSVRHHTVLPRFRDAFRGVWLAYREEPNLRFHVFAASVVGVVAMGEGLQGWEVAYLSITVALVLLAEMVNTAVERVVDYAAAGRRHPLAGAAKEVAAGAVLLTALHAGWAALYLFVVRRGFVETINGVLALLARSPWLLAVPLLTGLLGVYAGRSEQ